MNQIRVVAVSVLTLLAISVAPSCYADTMSDASGSWKIESVKSPAGAFNHCRAKPASLSGPVDVVMSFSGKLNFFAKFAGADFKPYEKYDTVVQVEGTNITRKITSEGAAADTLAVKMGYDDEIKKAIATNPTFVITYGDKVVRLPIANGSSLLQALNMCVENGNKNSPSARNVGVPVDFMELMLEAGFALQPVIGAQPRGDKTSVTYIWTATFDSMLMDGSYKMAKKEPKEDLPSVVEKVAAAYRQNKGDCNKVNVKTRPLEQAGDLKIQVLETECLIGPQNQPLIASKFVFFSENPELFRAISLSTHYSNIQKLEAGVQRLLKVLRQVRAKS